MTLPSSSSSSSTWVLCSSSCWFVPSFLLFLLLQAHSQSTFASLLLLLLQLMTDLVPLLFLSLVGGIFDKEHIKNAFHISSKLLQKVCFQNRRGSLQFDIARFKIANFRKRSAKRLAFCVFIQKRTFLA